MNCHPDDSGNDRQIDGKPYEPDARDDFDLLVKWSGKALEWIVVFHVVLCLGSYFGVMGHRARTNLMQPTGGIACSENHILSARG